MEPIDVLVVDDDRDMLDLSSTLLEREEGRLSVVTEASGDAALSALESRAIDCVVSDYEMPGMDGLALLRAVREDHPDIPFVLFTGRGSEAIAAEAISAGVTDYVQKGGGDDRYTVLANRVRNAVEGTRAQREADRHLRFLETILERANEVVAVIDEDRSVEFVSGAVETVLGYTTAEIEDRGPFAAVHPADRSRVEGQFAERLSDPDRPTGIEFRVTDAAGEVVTVEARAYNLLDEPGVEGIVVYLRSIEPTH